MYAVGRVRDADIQVWAGKLKLPEPLVNQGRLTLNHDHNTLNTLTRDPMLTVSVLIRARRGLREAALRSHRAGPMERPTMIPLLVQVDHLVGCIVGASSLLPRPPLERKPE